MSKKRGRKEAKNHLHIWDIPKKYFPRRTKAKEYAEDLIHMTSDLRDTNRRVQYSSKICAFNIKCIGQKSGFRPSRPEVFRELTEFAYHYENYCFRLFAFREKLLQFVNAILPVGYSENQVRIDDILINPIVKQAKLTGLFLKFRKSTALSKVIQDRTFLTHKLYYGKEFDRYYRPKVETEPKKPEQFKKWVDDWKKQIISRAQLTTACTKTAFDINNTIAQKIIDYKDSLKSKK